jgi:hypothetical protein
MFGFHLVRREGNQAMSKYKPQFEPNPTPDNPLVELTTKIEELIMEEPLNLAMSALVSATLRLETHLCAGNERAAAWSLARTFEDILHKYQN